MKKIFLRVLLWVFHVVYTQILRLQNLYRKSEKFISDLIALLFGGKEAYVRTRLSQLKKQPQHLVFSIMDSREDFELFSQQLTNLLILVSFTKTYIMTLYDASGKLQDNFPSFLETLKKKYFASAPNKKFYVQSSHGASKTIYCLDFNKEGQVKECSIESIPTSEGDYPFVVNILGPLDGYKDLLEKVNNKNKDAKLNMKELRSSFTCNRGLRILQQMSLKITVEEYDTSLMVVFSEDVDSCLGVPFDLLANAEIAIQKKFREYDSVSLLKTYAKFSQTKQRRGK